MKKELSTELVNNAFDFYNKKFGEIFSNTEYQNLSSKLQEIIKYDQVIKNNKLPYELPRDTLYLIYYIGEYKKAYQYAQKDKKEKSTDTFESLGKGFANKEKAYKEGLARVLDKSIDADERMKDFFKILMLLLLKKHAYKKVSMYFLGSMHMIFPLIKTLFNTIHQYNTFMQMAFSAIEYTREYFKYTHLAEDKILNSSLIVIYTFLTQNLKIDQDKAFRYSKELVNSFIDDKDYTTDRYRKDYLTDRDIYYTGIYQGMPIFQWYVSSQHKSYYTDQDIKKFKVLKRVLFNEKNLGFTANFMSMSILKLFNKKASSSDLSNVYASINSDTGIRTLLLSSHKQFASMPIPLLQYLPKPRKPFILRGISLFIGFYTKFAYRKTKFSKK
ncbi:MAG: hypothetical protein IBX55_19210 [Methyloprofundus sp.]|nr:hypothetical protein [Methyloprofundus sp.]